jgi:OOP family OmpA-OmpF porin
VLLAVWLFFSIRERRRWAGYVERLKAEPGIVVTEAGKHSGIFFVAGLRDPLAADPAGLLPKFKLKPEKVASRWEPYQALHADLVLKRAVTLLQPPVGVRLQIRDGVLFAEGRAPREWIESARQRAATLAGVQTLNAGALVEETAAALPALQREVERAVLFFEEGVRLAAGQEAAMGALAAEIQKLHDAAAGSGRRVRVAVIGHTDASGADEQNLRLSRQRADHVVSLLAARGVPSALLAPAGVGAREPVDAATSDTNPVRQRRVTFRVTLAEAPPGLPAP